MKPQATLVEEPPVQLGKYELISRIGHGGMAEVYLARMRGPMNFEKLVVVKTIHPDLVSQEEFLTMLFDEARLSALIRHPSVVDIYELGHVGDSYFIAMEYLDGQTLSALIAAGAKGFPLDPCLTARVIADAASGLHAAHELRTPSGKMFELVHRDVSPSNIMVLYDGNVKVLDFGVAKARGRLTTSAGRQLKGKIGYASPEQLSGDKVDRRSDVFSLGVVLWEALAHRRLFPGDELEAAADRARGADVAPPSTHSPQVPPQLDDVCLIALDPDPARRFQTAAQMKEALDDVLRSVGSHREADAIAQHMTRVFARRRDERNQLLRSTSVTGAEFAIHDDIHTETRQRVARGTPHLAEGPPAPQTVATGGRRWVIAAVVALLAILGGVVLWRKQLTSPTASGPRITRAKSGKVVSAPVALPAPDRPTATATATAPPVPADEATPLPPPIEGPPEPLREPAVAAPPPKKLQGSHAAPPPAKARRSADELYREGADLFVNGKIAEAKERFKDALDLDPGHAPSHRGLGLVYQSLGKRDKAIASFEMYLSLSPNAADAAVIRTRLEGLKK